VSSEDGTPKTLLDPRFLDKRVSPLINSFLPDFAGPTITIFEGIGTWYQRKNGIQKNFPNLLYLPRIDRPYLIAHRPANPSVFVPLFSMDEVHIMAYCWDMSCVNPER
jgi:hypothetical protein